jgi:hypothetical protein
MTPDQMNEITCRFWDPSILWRERWQLVIFEMKCQIEPQACFSFPSNCFSAHLLKIAPTLSMSAF